MFFEGLDNDHGRATGFAIVGAGGWIVVSDIGFCLLYIDTVIETFIADEVTQSLNIFDPDVIGEQAVVADAMEALRQHVDEKAPDKLIDRQGHGSVSITPLGTIVFPLEGDTAFIAGDEPAVTDGDPMGVARQVSEHGFGSGERTLGIGHPVDLV